MGYSRRNRCRNSPFRLVPKGASVRPADGAIVRTTNHREYVSSTSAEAEAMRELRCHLAL